MTKENLITVPVGTTLEQAEAILHKHRVEKLLVVDDKYTLKGLITVKDIQKKLKYPNAAKDPQGRLRAGAAIGATGDYLERAQELARAKVDVIAIDSAHGHSSRVLEAIKTVDRYLGIRSRVERSSTDANIPLALGIEAVSLGGGGIGGAAHSLHEWYDPAERPLGLKRLLLVTCALAGTES